METSSSPLGFITSQEQKRRKVSIKRTLRYTKFWIEVQTQLTQNLREQLHSHLDKNPVNESHSHMKMEQHRSAQ